MGQIIRRDAMTLLAGTGAGATLGLSGDRALTPEHRSTKIGTEAAMVQGTLTPAHRQGRKLTGFVETGIPGGQVLCSLVDQDHGNPAVQSVFAAPAQQNGRFGAKVTVSFFTEPLGHVTFSLLHVQSAKNAISVNAHPL
jgi:hypothetical protein